MKKAPAREDESQEWFQLCAEPADGRGSAAVVCVASRGGVLSEELGDADWCSCSLLCERDNGGDPLPPSQSNPSATAPEPTSSSSLEDPVS